LPQQLQPRAYLALFAVWFFWGTTYLGIRIALEGFPPLMLLAARFLISGSIMLTAVRLLKIDMPAGREFWLTALFGIILLGGGNGALVIAEQKVPSGLAALLVTTSPFFMVGFDAIFPGGERLHLPTLIGILVGFCGVVLLVLPNGFAAGIDRRILPGVLLLEGGCVLWCLGAHLQKRLATRAHPVVSGALQQFATGLFFVLPAFGIKEHPVRWNAHSTWALLYLVTFGSIVGYSAFIYALQHLPIAIVSTYNYVNPVVAIFLGWLFYREPLGWREFAAMGIIFFGVAIVRWTTHKKI
jgi:drug/metabolite transporter (DMT)-like permease